MLVQTGRVCVEGENGVGCQERLLSRADLAYNACWNCWVAVSVTVFSQGPGRPIHVFVSGDELLHSLLSQLNCLWVGARLIDRPYYILARGIHLWKMLSILLEVSQKPAWNPNSYSSRSVSKQKSIQSDRMWWTCMYSSEEMINIHETALKRHTGLHGIKEISFPSGSPGPSMVLRGDLGHQFLRSWRSSMHLEMCVSIAVHFLFPTYVVTHHSVSCFLSLCQFIKYLLWV